MITRKSVPKLINSILAAVLILLVFLLTAWKLDFFYALNDDVMMKDIMAGVLTGEPEGKNIQMLYPASLFISLFYHIGGNVSWYGIFLCLCNFGALYLIVRRSLEFVNNKISALLLLAGEGILILSFFLYNLTFVQYTVTAGLLASAAAFLFYTADSECGWRDYLKRNLVPILLVWLAFAVRSEMLLLLFPLFGVAGVWKWAEEGRIFTRENFCKYGSVLGSMLFGMAVLAGVDAIAYGSSDWKEFQNFFDARTAVYDYYGIPPYEENREFYETLPMSRESYELLVNYNFGLDETIDAEKMERIAQYSENLWKQAHPPAEQLKKSLWEYRYGNVNQRDTVLIRLVMAAYLSVILTGLSGRRFLFLWKPALLFAVRSALWLFIIYRERFPERITHPLLYAEFLILVSFLCAEAFKGKWRAGCAAAGTAIIVILGIFQISGSWQAADTEMDRREMVNGALLLAQEYAVRHPEEFYVFDIMSTVPYSEKLFGEVNNSYSRIGYAGGWISKSPLNHKKYMTAGIASESSSLIEGKKVYFLIQADRPVEWIREYYEARGIDVSAGLHDTIRSGEKDMFRIYQIHKEQ